MFILRFLRRMLLLAVLLALVALGFLFWASRGYDPDAPAQPPRTDEALLAEYPVPEPPTHLTVLSFNVAYGRGPADDLGDRRSEAEVRGFLSALATFIRSSGADIVALQEVDFDARRTHHIDQLAFLATHAGYPYSARITTWHANYVPFPYWPPAQHIGAIHSGQAVLSRFPITDNRRVVLPQPDAYPFWYNLFYLHRAIQVATVRIGERDVVIYNCHLEAFDADNRQQQARLLGELVHADSPGRWVVLGDMNSLPPEAVQRSNFADEPGWDATGDRTIDVLRELLGAPEAPGPETYATDPVSTFTFPATTPTRRLDYIFASRSLPVTEARIAAEAGSISDHLPVLARLQLLVPRLPRRWTLPFPGR